MKKYLLIILALSIATHFAFFGHPNETVFDEVHFGKFVSGYYTGEYYFDIHPPLGKLMIAGFAKLFDFSPEYNFTEIGREFPDKKYLALRFLPTLAGTLLPLIIFLLILELGISRMAAFAGALLVVFDNAFLTQSRLMLLDPFLLLFGFTSLLFYFRYRRQPMKQENPPRHHSHILENMRMMWNWNLFWMAIFAGLAISIKWTGLSFIALPILIEVTKTLKIPETAKTVLKLAIASFRTVLKISSFFLISLAIYFSVFALHFALLPNPGPGDAFMKPGFRENNIVKNISDLNIEMYKSNQRLSATHPYSSQWYTWPLMTRSIFYWVKDTPSTHSINLQGGTSSEPQPNSEPVESTSSEQVSRIYFLGNPVIWWSSTVALIYGLWIMYHGIISRTKKIYSIFHTPYFILFTGYFLNMLPFVGVKRIMFLYHYLTALIFAILILCYLIDPERTYGRDESRPTSYEAGKTKKWLLVGLVATSIATFLFFSPLTYGLSLSEKAYDARVWFASWR